MTGLGDHAPLWSDGSIGLRPFRTGTHGVFGYMFTLQENGLQACKGLRHVMTYLLRGRAASAIALAAFSAYRRAAMSACFQTGGVAFRLGQALPRHALGPGRVVF